MELRDMKTFAEVARLLSFQRAGTTLHAAQSTVSARIAALEGELGVRLFERTGHRVALTDVGAGLLDYVRKILDLEEEARTWATSESEARGSLSIRTPEYLCAFRMGGVIRRFRERFPLISLDFTACTYESLGKNLRQGVTDLAFLLTDSIRAADLVAEALGVERLVLVAGPEHRLAGAAQVGAEDLRGETLVLSKEDCAYRRILENILDANGIKAGARVEFSSAAALCGCVSNGVGVSLLPELAVREHLAAGRITVLPWAEGELETAVLMIRHKDKWLSPPLAAFMDMARREFSGIESAR